MGRVAARRPPGTSAAGALPAMLVPLTWAKRCGWLDRDYNPADDRSGRDAGGGDPRRGHLGDAPPSPHAGHARAAGPGRRVLLGRRRPGARPDPAHARRADEPRADDDARAPRAGRAGDRARGAGPQRRRTTATCTRATRCCASTASRSPTRRPSPHRHDRLQPGDVVTFEIERGGARLTRRATAVPVLTGRWQWAGVALRVLLVFALFLGIPSIVFKWRPDDPRALLFMLFGTTFGLSMLNFSVPGLSQPPESVLPLPDAFTPLQPDVAGDHLRLRARDQPDAPPLPGALPAAAPRARPARTRPALDVPRAVAGRLARRAGDRAAVGAVAAGTGASGRGAGRRGRGRRWRDARVVDAPARPLVAQAGARRRALARRGGRAGLHGAGAGRDRGRRPAVARDRRAAGRPAHRREPWCSSRSASASPTRWPAASRCGDRGGSVRRTCAARFAGRS